MTDQNVDLDELDRLHAAATPGEWFNVHGVALCPVETHPGVDFEDVNTPNLEGNAALIVALHNLYPAIAAELRELRLHRESANEQCRHLAGEVNALEAENDGLKEVRDLLMAEKVDLRAENERLRDDAARWHDAQPVVGAARWLVINRAYAHLIHAEIDNIADALETWDERCKARAALAPEKPHD